MNSPQFLRKVRDISLSTSFLLAFGFGMSACEEEHIYEKGIQTFVTETEKGVFKIVDEKVVEDTTKSCVIVNYLDGRMDTMSIAKAQQIAQTQLPQYESPSYVPDHDYSLGTVLLFGGAGLLMGSALRDYRYRRESNYSGAGGYGSRYYQSATVYRGTRNSISTFKSSGTTRSGFFGSSSRGSSSS